MNIRLVGVVFLTIFSLTSGECWAAVGFEKGEGGILVVWASRSRRDVRAVRRMRQTYLDRIRAPNTISGSIPGMAYYGQFSFDRMKSSHAVPLFQARVLIWTTVISYVHRTVPGLAYDRLVTILIPTLTVRCTIHRISTSTCSNRLLTIIDGQVPDSMLKLVVGMQQGALDGLQRGVIINIITGTHLRHTHWCTSSAVSCRSFLDRMFTEKCEWTSDKQFFCKYLLFFSCRIEISIFKYVELVFCHHTTFNFEAKNVSMAFASFHLGDDIDYWRQQGSGRLRI